MKSINDMAFDLFQKNADPYNTKTHELLIKQCFAMAKQFNEFIVKNTPTPEHDFKHVIIAFKSGKHIQSIKELRNLTSMGLKQAKDIMDLVRDTHDLNDFEDNIKVTIKTAIQHHYEKG